MPYRQGAGGARTLSGWECVWIPLGEGEERKLFEGREAGWEPVQVPAQMEAMAGRQAVWYRTRFARPDHTGRVLIRFGGAFLAANVWLNGRLLGSHYGYFGPFGFDLTSFLKPENVLVVCCETPMETDLTRKRHVTGIFGDGESRPYPGSTYFSLPDSYRWSMPIGLWAPVELEYVGPIAIDWVRLVPRLEAGDVGRLEVEARLRNLDGREMAGELGFEVAPPSGSPLRLRRAFTIPGSMERTLAFSLSIPQPQRWWPRGLGEPTTYGVRTEVRIEDELSARVDDHFGFRDLEVRASPEGWSVGVNGQPLFLKGASYMPDLRLDRLSPERFQADLDLARRANLNLLRVHGHVLPTEFYECADAAGILVVAEFPLTLAYGYHAPSEEASFFENAVRELIPEMVELLRNRPSVAWWVAHDDPPWIAANSELGDVHAVRQNYSIDQEARALFQRLDPTRLALAASGDLDAHVYAGWKEPWSRFGDRTEGLVSELGAQSLPSPGSPVWPEISPAGRFWPVGDAEPDWLYAGFQPVAWAEQGVGLPSEHASLDDLIQASQGYQAWVITYGVEQMRKRKFEPCFGAFVFSLVDPFPAIGFSVVDHAREPKLALEALARAFAPTRVILDPVGFEIDPPDGVRFRPGRPAVVRLVVVNDDPNLAGAGRVRWWVERAASGDRISALLRLVRRGSYSGGVHLDLPEAWEPAVQAASLTLPLGGEGAWRLHAELTVGSRVVDRTHLDLHVATPPPGPRRRRPMPGYLHERLVEASSLGREGTGIRFTLLNRTRPAVLGAAEDFELDGTPLLGVAPRLEGGLPLPRRLDLPVDREVRLVVEPRHPVPEGRHRLCFHLDVPGVASGIVTVEGEL